MRNIGVFGGTFNPLHNRELELASCAVNQVHLEKVIFVPNGTPPHKKFDVLDKELRFELVAAGIAGHERFEASRVEIDRPGVTWTIDTLKELQQTLGADVRLHFIIGADNVKNFATYDRRAEFFGLCKLLIAPRQADHSNDVADWRKLLPEAELEMINIAPSPLSSTEIRAKIRRGESIDTLVPAAVKAIIVERRLYLDAVTQSVA